MKTEEDTPRGEIKKATAIRKQVTGSVYDSRETGQRKGFVRQRSQSSRRNGVTVIHHKRSETAVTDNDFGVAAGIKVPDRQTRRKFIPRTGRKKFLKLPPRRGVTTKVPHSEPSADSGSPTWKRKNHNSKRIKTLFYTRTIHELSRSLTLTIVRSIPILSAKKLSRNEINGQRLLRHPRSRQGR